MVSIDKPTPIRLSVPCNSVSKRYESLLRIVKSAPRPTRFPMRLRIFLGVSSQVDIPPLSALRHRSYRCSDAIVNRMYASDPFSFYFQGTDDKTCYEVSTPRTIHEHSIDKVEPYALVL